MQLLKSSVVTFSVYFHLFDVINEEFHPLIALHSSLHQMEKVNAGTNHSMQHLSLNCVFQTKTIIKPKARPCKRSVHQHHQEKAEIKNINKAQIWPLYRLVSSISSRWQ